MNENIKKIVSAAKTDISGKWISVDEAANLVKLAICECLPFIEPMPESGDFTDRVFASTIIEIKTYFGIENE